jgi:hypothetical protein
VPDGAGRGDLELASLTLERADIEKPEVGWSGGGLRQGAYYACRGANRGASGRRRGELNLPDAGGMENDATCRSQLCRIV